MYSIPAHMQRKIFELTLAVYRVTDFFPEKETLRRQLREKANEIFGACAEYASTSDLSREAALILAKIHSMSGFLKIAGALHFVKPINIAVLDREYNFLADIFNREFRGKDTVTHEPTKPQYIKPAESAGSINSQSIYGVKHSNGPSAPLSDNSSKGLLSFNSDTEHIQKSFATAKSQIVSAQGSYALNDRQKTILKHMENSGQAKISDLFSFFQEVSSKTIQRDLQDLVTRSILRKEGEKRWTVYSLAKE